MMNGNGNGSSSWGWSSLWGRARRPDQNLAPYRRIALQLHYDLPRPEGHRSVLLVTPTASPLWAPGSTALAGCLAEELLRPVLLIDASARGSEVSRMLDCVNRRGFSDLLAEPKLSLDEIALPTTQANVWFLPAGNSTGPSRSAPPEEVTSFLNSVENRYDFVLLAGGSVLENSMALALAPYVGCVLLLVIENQTTVEELDAAQDALGFCKARKVGLVLTGPTRSVDRHA